MKNTSVSAAELKALRQNGALFALVDVRDAEELEAGFIPASIHIPFLEMEKYAAMLLPDKKMTVVVHCATGRRSSIAAETLRRLGYEDVRNLEGGFEAYD